MSIVTAEHVLMELESLLNHERLLEKLLERASRSPEDPREVAYLWNLATECRDHARILSRHRRELDRQAADVPYPRWPRGKGPQPEEALELAREMCETLAGEYRSSESLSDNLYLRKFLAILGEEHDRRAMELKGVANGSGIFEEIEDADVDVDVEVED
jgi:hypothetical protein